MMPNISDAKPAFSSERTQDVSTAAEFHREYLSDLPLPLAKLYSLAYNAKDIQARHNHSFFLFEALVKLTAAPLVMAYARERQEGANGNEELNQQLLGLARPSFGHWVGLLRELVRYFGQGPGAVAGPLDGLWQQMERRHRDKPAFLNLYRRIKNGPDGVPAGDQSCSIRQVLEALAHLMRAGMVIDRLLLLNKLLFLPRGSPSAG